MEALIRPPSENQNGIGLLLFEKSTQRGLNNGGFIHNNVTSLPMLISNLSGDVSSLVAKTKALLSSVRNRNDKFSASLTLLPP